MGGARERGRQKKLEKARKKRELARKQARQEHARMHPRGAELMRRARQGPFGPAWVATSLDDDSTPPALVTVVVSRHIGGGLLVAEFFLVDRTCLGVKNANVLGPLDEADLEAQVALASANVPMRRCEPLVAQSVVFHAVDYARSLGFGPHHDYEPALIEPRPEALVDTPMSRPERPYYMSGPYDDVPRILRTLEAAVGDGYDALDVDTVERLPEDAGDDEPIDWRLATQATPVDDVLAGIDLDTDAGLSEAVDTLVSALQLGFFLQWEAAIRFEQDLAMTEVQGILVNELLSFEDRDEPIHYIDGVARPHEPWYATARHLAPRLVLERFATWEASSDEPLTRGLRLVDAVARHAAELSLPEGCARAEDVLSPEVQHRLRIQAAFAALSGLGQERGDATTSLADPAERWRIEEFRRALRGVGPSLAALGWTVDDLFQVLLVPDGDRAVLRTRLESAGAEAASAASARSLAASRSAG